MLESVKPAVLGKSSGYLMIDSAKLTVVKKKYQRACRIRCSDDEFLRPTY